MPAAAAVPARSAPVLAQLDAMTAAAEDRLQDYGEQPREARIAECRPEPRPAGQLTQAARSAKTMRRE